MSDLLRITERYRLDKLIHASDTASVFRAADLRSGETVALKLIRVPARRAEPVRSRHAGPRELPACEHPPPDRSWIHRRRQRLPGHRIPAGSRLRAARRLARGGGAALAAARPGRPRGA